MRRCTTPRRHVLVVQLGVLASCHAFVAACAPPTRYEEPSDLRAYEILITRHDSLGRELAHGLARRGFRVRDRVRGGARPTAYLFAFTFRETDPPGGGVTWLDVRLADTRTGAIVAAVSLPLDSLGGGPLAEHAAVIVDSLAASAALRRSLPPP